MARQSVAMIDASFGSTLVASCRMSLSVNLLRVRNVPDEGWNWWSVVELGTNSRTPPMSSNADDLSAAKVRN